MRTSAWLPLLALAGCAAPGRGTAARELEVAAKVEATTDLQLLEGDLGTVTFQIRNGTDRYLLLRDLRIEEESSAAVTWQFAEGGQFEYVPGRDEWIYDRRKPDRRQVLLNSGLLLPTEVISVRTRVRLLHFPKTFHLRYFDLSRADLSEKVYFDQRLGREIRYRRLVGRELDLRLLPSAKTDAGGHRVVVFPHAEEVNPTAKTRAVRVEASLRPRPLSALDAARKAGVAAPDEYTYSTTLGGWVIRSRDQAWAVSTGGVLPLPALKRLEQVFYYLDGLGMAKAEIDLGRESVAVALREKRYEVLAHREDGKDRYLLFLRSIDLARLFADLRELKLGLDLEALPDGRVRLGVTMQ